MMSPVANTPAASLGELNSLSTDEFRNKFLPHHPKTGWLYLTRPEKKVTEPVDLDREPVEGCVYVIDPPPEDPDENKSDEDEAKMNSTPTPHGHRPRKVAVKSSNEYVIRFMTSESIERSDLSTCLDLIALTSSAHYKASSIGWSPAKKRAEMLLDDMKYLLWSKKESSRPGVPTYKVEGFLSFMLTYEDDIPVIYCYEIHLNPRLQGRGIGKMLMGMMENVGRQAGVRKAMLTVFTRNKAARGCYERMGYDVDEFSPSSKSLRGGKTKEPEYVILSKPLF